MTESRNRCPFSSVSAPRPAQADAVFWTYGIAGLFNVIHNEPEKVAPHSEGCFLGPCIIV